MCHIGPAISRIFDYTMSGRRLASLLGGWLLFRRLLPSIHPARCIRQSESRVDRGQGVGSANGERRAAVAQEGNKMNVAADGGQQINLQEKKAHKKKRGQSKHLAK